MKTVYRYNKSKLFVAALVLGIVGFALAAASLSLNAVKGTFLALSIVFGVLTIGACVITVLSTYGKTTLTLPAIIVTALALVGGNVTAFIDDVGTNSRFYAYDDVEVMITSLAIGVCFVAAWVLFILGHRKISKGVRSNKLILVGLCAISVVAIAAVAMHLVFILDGNVGIVFPNIFAYAGTLCVAVAYFLLSRVTLNGEVVELADTTNDVECAETVETTVNDEQPKNKKEKVKKVKAEKPTRDDFAPQNIALNILLTVVTCGIYGYVWFYRNAKQVRHFNGESVKGCGDELLLFIFGGILYRAYWYYTRAKLLNASARVKGCEGAFLNPLLYLLLTVLTPSVVQLAFLTASFNNVYARENSENAARGELSDEAKGYLADRQSLLKTVLLSIVTCGVYYVITQARIANRIKLMQGKATADTGELICMLLVPIYWIVWLITRRGKYHEGSNEATLEAWLLIVVPFYPIYWLVTRTDQLRACAAQFGVQVAEEAVWTLLFAIIVPEIAFFNMLINLNKVADNFTVTVTLNKPEKEEVV